MCLGGCVELVYMLVDGCHRVCKSGEQFMIGGDIGSEVDQSFTVFSRWLGFGGGFMVSMVAMEASLFGGAKLVTKKTLGIVELGFEVGPSLFWGRAIVPLFAFFEVLSSFEDKSVGNAEELFGGVWLATIFSVVLSIFNLLDEAVKGTVGVPIRSHFGRSLRVPGV